jgi:uncharacterized protein (TIGR02246 family)
MAISSRFPAKEKRSDIPAFSESTLGLALTVRSVRTTVLFAKRLAIKEKPMKRAWILCLASMFLLVSAAWSQDGSEKAVAALEQKWLDSQKTNNPDMVAPLLSDKFVNTGSDGKVTSKAESLASAKATKYESVAYDDVKVTAIGDTAVATGDFKAKGTDPEGKPLDVHERFTDTWVKGPKGQWQCIASHQSTVKM